MKLRRTVEILTPAKINLFLNIQNKRSDGYHNLKMDLIPISLYDRIVFSDNDANKVDLKCNLDLGPNVDNLVVKAVKALEVKTDSKISLSIKLEKNIPAGAGLGGGSGNAGGTLVALNKALDLGFSFNDLKKIALSIGSDVPFFIQPRPAIVTGIGENPAFLPAIKTLHLLLLFPGFSISTKEAYASCVISGGQTGIDDYSWQKLAEMTPELNDFWISLVRKHPVLEECRKELKRAGAVAAGLSGSGSAVFGIFPDGKSRNEAFAKLNAGAGWRCFSCETLNHHKYL